jgi:DNA-damage-inducible protein D
VSSILPSNGISPFDSIKRTDGQGEYWTGRDAMPVMEYSRWEDFAAVIEKAKDSLALVQGADQAGHHFREMPEVIPGGRWGKQTVASYRLTRFGAYLVAMAGDDTKEAVAHARVYFAIQTRKAEVAAAPALPQDYEQALVALLGQVRDNKALASKVAALEPAAAAWERLASANGDLSVRTAANMLNRDPNISTGQNRLFAVIRGLGMVSSGDVPYAKHSDHLRLKPGGEYEDRRTGDKKIGDPQLRVTIRGLGYLHKRMGGVVDIKHHVQAEIEFGQEDAA